MKCEQLKNGMCLIASSIAGFECPVSESTCNACKKHHTPMTENLITRGLASAKLINVDRNSEADDLVLMAIWENDKKIPGVYGPGDALHSALKKMGFRITQNCQCRKHLLRMNREGTEWCFENIDLIVTWLQEEAKRRKLSLMFIKAGVKLFIYRILKAHKKLEAKGTNK